MYRSNECRCNMPNTNYSNYTYKNNRAQQQNNSAGYYDERGFWIPFVVGGLAGGALGYGVANNNFLSNNYNNQPVPYPIFYPAPAPYPMPYPYY